MGCAGSVHASAAEQRLLEERLRQLEEREAQHLEREAQHLEMHKRLIGLLEAQATGRANFAPEESAYAHSNPAASRMGHQLQPPSAVALRLPAPKFALRKELQQLQALEAPSCDLNALVSRQDIVNSSHSTPRNKGLRSRRRQQMRALKGCLARGNFCLR